MSQISTGRESATALEHVADAVDETAHQQKSLARLARRSAGLLRGGMSWADLAERGVPRKLLAGLLEGAGRLTATAGRLRIATIGALIREGLTTRQVGRHLGISHQRVSHLQSQRSD